MVTTQQTFGLYLADILDSVLAPDAPQRLALLDLFIKINDTPLAELTDEMPKMFEIMASVPEGYKLAFQIGTQIPLTAYTAMAMPMKFAPTIGDMLQFLSSFVDMLAPLLSAKYTPTDDGASVTVYSREPLSPHAESFVAIGAFVTLASEMGSITGQRNNFDRLELKECPPEALAMFKKLLKITPQTGADNNTVFISKAVLNTPNPFADPLSFKSYVEQMKEMAKEQLASDSVSDTVKQKIVAAIETPPGVEEMAKALNMTARQLRFALAKESTSYRELLQDARVEFARVQLANPRMTVAKLAHRLGYADVTAFNHGFKRWTGKSPTQFQADLLKK